MVGPDDSAEASFDLTPMIDVIFLLIIFFMLSSQFASTEARPVDLPREPGMETVATEAEVKLLIDIDREGAYSVMGEPATLESLARMAAPRPTASGSIGCTPWTIGVVGVRRARYGLAPSRLSIACVTLAWSMNPSSPRRSSVT